MIGNETRLKELSNGSMHNLKTFEDILRHLMTCGKISTNMNPYPIGSEIDQFPKGDTKEIVHVLYHVEK